MAAPRKNTQPANTNSGDVPDEAEAKVTPADTVETLDGQQHDGVLPVRIAVSASHTEDVTLAREAGGHKAGDTISVTPGAAEYLREQGYVDRADADEDEDED